MRDYLGNVYPIPLANDRSRTRTGPALQNTFNIYLHEALAACPGQHDASPIPAVPDPACLGNHIEDRRPPAKLDRPRPHNMPSGQHTDGHGRNHNHLARPGRGIRLDASLKDQAIICKLKGLGFRRVPAVVHPDSPHVGLLCRSARSSDHVHKSSSALYGVHPWPRHLPEHRQALHGLGNEEHVPVGKAGRIGLGNLPAQYSFNIYLAHRRGPVRPPGEHDLAAVPVLADPTCSNDGINRGSLPLQLHLARTPNIPRYLDTQNRAWNDHNRAGGHLGVGLHIPGKCQVPVGKFKRSTISGASSSVNPHIPEVRAYAGASRHSKKIEKSSIGAYGINPGPRHLTDDGRLLRGFGDEYDIA